MLYITGDTHGKYDPFLSRLRTYSLSKEDTVIVCGDFGFVWDIPQYRYFLAKLTAAPFTIAFVDGNHEDFYLLNTFPIINWNGGNVHKIAGNIYHLMRGQCFEIEGKSFFTMGGAYSIDRATRIEGVSWWREELPTDEEYKIAEETLKQCGYTVDYVLTHDIPKFAIYELGFSPDENGTKLTEYFDLLYEKMKFKKWFAGHYHVNRLVHENLQILFDDVALLR